MKFNSIKFKISIFYTAILGLVLCLYTGLLYYNLNFALYRDLDNSILIKAQEVSSAINSYMDVLGSDQKAFDFAAGRVIRLEGTHQNQDKVAEVEKKWLQERVKQDLANAYINVADVARGASVINSVNMDNQMVALFMKDTPTAGKKALSYKDLNFSTHRLRVINIPFYHTLKNKKQIYLIQIGVSRKPVYKILYGWLIFSVLTIPLILLIATFFGGMITDRVLRPIMEITKIARNITHKDLSIRVSTDRNEEEIKYLVSAFNEMISRLDSSFRYIAEFSSNVAHELKTPLTIIRGESELALIKERQLQEYQSAIKVTLEETGVMLKIVEDLLLLSKLEYQPDAFNLEPIDLGIFLKGIFEQAKKMASPKNISVEFYGLDKPVIVMADSLHLKRMFINLVNNAVKFTPAKGRIVIEMQSEGRKVKISVNDTGIGIKPQDIDKIFDRFFHVDHSDLSAEAGTGLGLSIAQSIAKIHQGSISVSSQPQKGSTFTVSLPTD